MASENREKVEHEEKQLKKKERPKEDYKKPELTKFGPVEEFTGSEPS